MDLINLLCCYFDNALVSTSTTMSSIEQYLNMSLPFSTHFWTKWCSTSRWFVRTCWVGFFVNDIAPWLSHCSDAYKWTCEHECKPMSMNLWVGTNIFGIFWWRGQNILKIFLCHVEMMWEIFLGKKCYIGLFIVAQSPFLESNSMIWKKRKSNVVEAHIFFNFQVHPTII
jgi:hypothetical protein